MLVLARKPNQKIMIGDQVIIKVLRKTRDTVKLGIEAPLEVPVHRQEIYEEIQRSNQGALRPTPPSIPSVTHKPQSSVSAPAHNVPPGPFAK